MDKPKAFDTTDARVYGPGEPTDLDQVPGQLHALRREVHSGFELLANRILPELTAIKALVVDLKERVSDLETKANNYAARLDAIEARLPKPRKRK